MLSSSPQTPASSSTLAALDDPIEYTSPLSGELHDLHRNIGREDGIATGSLVEELGQNLGSFQDQTSSTPAGMLPPFSSPSERRVKAWELKMDGPLTSPMACSPPKAVTFSDINIKSFIGDANDNLQISDEEGLDDIFREIIEPDALKIQHEVEHEQLHAADSESRMLVPTLDATVPEPPWKHIRSEVEDREDVARLMLLVSLMKLHHWPGVSKLEATVPWAPFHPNLAKVAVHENFDDHRSLDKLLSVDGFGDALDVDSLTWKPEGLRILNAPDDEQQDLHLNDDCAAFQITPLQTQARIVSGGVDYTTKLSNKRRPSPESDLRSNGGPCRTDLDVISTTDNLDMFMLMQGRPSKHRKSEHKRNTGDHDQTSKQPATSAASSKPAVRTDTVSTESNILPCTIPFNDSKARETLPPRAVIVSSNFFDRKGLLRQLSDIWPSLDLIERDWSANLPSASRTERIVDEGDIICSAAETIICTNITAITQKPLPGQGSESVIRARLRRITDRFEHITVLVVGGDQSNAKHLHEMSTFTAFCASLEAKIAVHPVSSDGTDLAQTLVTIISSENTLPDTFTLLHEETLWERFLRSAGLSTIAAQVIASSFQRPVNDTPEDETVDFSEGLADFVALLKEERIERFEALLGGRRALTIVSDVLDSQWPSRRGHVAL